MLQILIEGIQSQLRCSILSVLLAVFLSGCTSAYKNSNSGIIDIQSFYQDQLFAGFEKIILESADEVFAIDDEMRQIVEQELLPINNYKQRATQLLQHIFSKNNINLSYQNNANLTAIQTYNSQKANCISLTIMAFALAKEAGLKVKFQQLEVPEYWIRNGNYNLLAGHVNLVITSPSEPSKFNYLGNDILEIDFDPFIVKKTFPKTLINQSTVLAMFYNNKAAQLLILNKHLEAYAYIREAIQVAPEYSSSWSNLGILYKLNGNPLLANRVYRHAIALDSNNLTALTNLLLLLEEQGDVEEVKAINIKLTRKRSKNPYYHALLASNAYHNGDLQKSLQLYRKAIRLNSKIHQFYYGIAMVYYNLDEWSEAESAIRKALAHNQIDSTKEEYIVVLDSIKMKMKP